MAAAQRRGLQAHDAYLSVRTGVSRIVAAAAGALNEGDLAALNHFLAH